MLQEGTGAGGRCLLLPLRPPLPSQSLPEKQSEHDELPSGIRHTEMVHCITEPKGNQSEEEIAVAMVTAVLEEMMTHFLLHRTYWVRYGRTWCMLRKGREESSRTDYRRWWDKEVINLEGATSTSGVVEAALEEEVEERVVNFQSQSIG